MSIVSVHTYPSNIFIMCPTFRDFCNEEGVLEKSYVVAMNLEKLTSKQAQQGLEAMNYIKSNNNNH